MPKVATLEEGCEHLTEVVRLASQAEHAMEAEGVLTLPWR